MTHTRTWRSWVSMFERCRNPRHESYNNYGGRGIKICERWQEFEHFLADMGERPAGKTLDRRDNDGHYEPENCRWADSLTQRRNTRRATFIEFNGERRRLYEWAALLGVTSTTLLGRLRRQPLDKALNRRNSGR